MKNILTAFCLLWLLLVSPAHADIIPKDMKPIIVSAKIENLADFPEYTFVQIETLHEVRSQIIIGSDGEITKGYKLNKLRLLAVPVSRLKVGDDFNGQALLNDPSIARFDGDIEVGQELVPRTSLESGKKVTYSIVSIDGGIISLKKMGEQEIMVEPGMTIGYFNRAFLLTLCVEVVVMFLLIRFGNRSKTPGAIRIGLSVLAGQTATLPLLWYLMTQFSLIGVTVFLLAEAFAVAVEGAIYKPLLRMTWTEAMFASLLCNAVSVFIGMWV
jgi:hypothetical protein